MIVVDTNVISELMKERPDEAVATWARNQTDDEVYTTSITLAEVLYGIERLPGGQRKELLRDNATEVFATFEDQVLSFDADAAQHYSVIADTRERVGLPISGFDAQIASICRAAGAVLATRNTKDFDQTGVDLIDPWLHR